MVAVVSTVVVVVVVPLSLVVVVSSPPLLLIILSPTSSSCPPLLCLSASRHPHSALVRSSSLFPPLCHHFVPPHKQLLIGLGAGGVSSGPHHIPCHCHCCVPCHCLHEAGGRWCAIMTWQQWCGVMTWQHWHGVMTWQHWQGVISCEFLVLREEKKQISQFTKKETNEKTYHAPK